MCDLNLIKPYHYVNKNIMGKWKMSILHHIFVYKKIRFHQLLKSFQISEKVLSQHLKELVEAGLLVKEVISDTEIKTEYSLSIEGEKIVEAIDQLFIWAIKDMKKKEIKIDPDVFVIHNDIKYIKALEDIVNIEEYIETAERARKIHKDVFEMDEEK